MTDELQLVMPSRRKAVIGVAVSLLMVMTAIALFAAERDPGLLVVALGLSPLVVIWTRRLARPEPTLTLSADGVQVRDLAFIPWQDLERLVVFRNVVRFLGFRVSDPNTIRLPANVAQRVWRAANRTIEGAPVTVTENLIDGTFEDVVPLILEHKVVPVDWRG